MWENDGIYAPGPIRPVVEIRQNLAIFTGGKWEHYRADYIEPMPRSTPLVVDLVVLSGATTLAANGAIAKILAPALQLNQLEFLHLRWEPLDNVEGILWEQAGQGRFMTRGATARVDRNTRTYDPYLATTTFFILGPGRDLNLEARNPMGYATPTARFAFWGYRYLLTDIIPDALLSLPESLTPEQAAAGQYTKARGEAALRAGIPDAVKKLIGPTTWLPAEGRAA